MAKSAILGVILGLLFILIGSGDAAKVNITVSDAPKLVGLVDELNNPEDTNATITCSVGSGVLQGLSYEWFKDKERLSGNSGKIRIDIPGENYQSVLRIFNLTPRDSALYTCVAKNRFGQDKISTKLNVKVQLKWLEEPSDAQISVGREVRVPCRADGNPTPKIDWRRLDDNGNLVRTFGNELYFPTVEQSDSGLYECRANNGLDDDLVARVRLNVLGEYQYSRVR